MNRCEISVLFLDFVCVDTVFNAFLTNDPSNDMTTNLPVKTKFNTWLLYFYELLHEFE